MDPMSGRNIRLVFTLPPSDSTLQYKRCVHFWNNFPCITSLGSPWNFGLEELLENALIFKSIWPKSKFANCSIPWFSMLKIIFVFYICNWRVCKKNSRICIFNYIIWISNGGINPCLIFHVFLELQQITEKQNLSLI